MDADEKRRRQADAELQKVIARVVTLGLDELGKSDPEAVQRVHDLIDSGDGQIRIVAWLDGPVHVYLARDGEPDAPLFSIEHGAFH